MLRMLEKEPEKRITAEEALSHPFTKDIVKKGEKTSL